MRTLDSELSEPVARMTDAAASALLDRHWGIPGAEVTHLGTERDDAFRVHLDDTNLVLKVSHPGDDALVVNLQTSAMSFASEVDSALPLQRALQTVDGRIEPEVCVDGRTRIARVLTWLPGRPLHELSPSVAQLELIGETLGRLTASLRGFDHPAAHRELVWDIARLPLTRPLVEEFPFAEVVEAFALFNGIAPLLDGLPHQVVHNDLHQGNVLADPAARGYVTGIIDFGDSVYTARIADLAVAVSYLLHPAGRSGAEIERFVTAYRRHVPLLEAEINVLPTLVVARLAQRTLIGSRIARLSGETVDDAAAKVTGVRATLRDLIERLPASRR